MTTSGARYPPGPVSEQLTAPTPGIRHALHRALAPTEQLTDEVLDLALEPLQVLYPQAHIPPTGTYKRLSRLGLQHGVKGTHAGGVVGQWLTLRNPSTAQGHLYLHQLLFFPWAAPKHRQQDPYDTHPERLVAQSFPQPASHGLPQGQGQEALLQGPLLDATTAVQQRGRGDTDGAEPDRTTCGVLAWTAAPRPGHHRTQAVPAGGPHGAGVHGGGRLNRTRGGLGGALAAPSPLPGCATPPTSCNACTDGAPHGGAAVRYRSGATGRRRGKLCPPPRPGADRRQHTRAAA